MRKNLRHMNYDLHQHHLTDYCTNQKMTNPESRYLLIIQAIKSFLDKFHPFNHTNIKKSKPNKNPNGGHPNVQNRLQCIEEHWLQMTLKNYIILKEQKASTKRIIKRIKKQSCIHFCIHLPSKPSTKIIWNKITYFTYRRTSSAYPLPQEIPKDKQQEYLKSIKADWVEKDLHI